ncbi:MAG: hypothetical protein R3C58_11010 [Parvularculaceae bacterium]
MALLDAWALPDALAKHADVDAALMNFLRAPLACAALSDDQLHAPVYQSDAKMLPALRDLLAEPLSNFWFMPNVLASMVVNARRAVGKIWLVIVFLQSTSASARNSQCRRRQGNRGRLRHEPALGLIFAAVRRPAPVKHDHLLRIIEPGPIPARRQRIIDRVFCRPLLPSQIMRLGPMP